MSKDPEGVTDNDGEDFAASVQNIIINWRESLARDLLAEDFYTMLKKEKKLDSHRVLMYRCPPRKRKGKKEKSSCLLLDVLTTPQGVIVHVNGHKNSPEMNAATSTEAGRLKNTEDGNRKWKGQTFFLGPAINPVLNCDQIDKHRLTWEQLQADLKMSATRPKVTIYP